MYVFGCQYGEKVKQKTKQQQSNRLHSFRSNNKPRRVVVLKPKLQPHWNTNGGGNPCDDWSVVDGNVKLGGGEGLLVSLVMAQ